jgi:DNA mismatch repair protein MutS
MLNPRWVVTNDVELGAIVKKRTLRVDAGSPVQSGCAIVTGPNAAGKTINLKSIISAVILATRTGIAPASSMKFTPFARMDTHMEVADKVGSMSRFESEKNSAIQFLQNLQQLHPNEFQLELMDEIFSSTNPEEGQSLAYAIASSLVDSPNCMCFIATHFKKLTELEAATNGYYKNYKVFVTVKPDGTFNRPYRLESGISDQNIAILMCKDEFSSKITDKAYQVLSQIKADTSDIVGYKKTPVAN